MNEPYRLRYANQIVGVFLLCLFVGIILLGVAVTRVSRIFVKPDRFYVELSEKEAADLQSGTDVVLLGKRVGRVDTMEYVDLSDRVRITLAIDPDHSNLITTDSELKVERKMGLGTAIIKVHRRASSSREVSPLPLKPGETIRHFLSEGDGVQQMAGEVKKAGDSIEKVERKLNPTLDSIDQTANTLTNSLQRSINPAFDNTRTAMETIKQTSEEFKQQSTETLGVIRRSSLELEADLKELTERVRAIIEGDVRGTLHSIGKSADAAKEASEKVSDFSQNIDERSDKTNDSILETLKNLRNAISSIQRLTNEMRQVVQIVRGEAEELPGTAERVNDTIGDTQNLVQEIRGHWLLRRGQRNDSPTQQVSPSSLRLGGTQ